VTRVTIGRPLCGVSYLQQTETADTDNQTNKCRELLSKPYFLPINWGGNKNKGGGLHRADEQRAAEPLQSYIALLDLMPIRTAIRPEDWPRQRHKIVAVVQHAARTLISEKDAFTIHGNEVCIATFGETTREIASLNAAAIGHKIVRSLLGVHGVGRISLTPSVFALADLLQPGESDTDAPGDAARIPAAAKRPAQPDREDKRKKLLDMYGDDCPNEISNTYLPVWNMETRLARTFQLLPCCRRTGADPVYGYDALPESRTDANLVEFDIGGIEGGLLDLKQAIDAGHETKLLLPLHFATAGSNQGRAELTEIFPRLPAFVRERLSFALYGVPGGVPQGRLHQVFSTLRPMVKLVSVVLEPNAESGPTLWNVAARMRAVGMPHVHIMLPEDPYDDVLDRARSICSRAASMGLTVGALGLRRGQQAHRLSVAGCTFFGGPLFGGPFEDLPVPYRVHSKVFEQND